MPNDVKVFISWSGELSRKLADEVRKWLPSVLQYVEPYFTPTDIEKGKIWTSSIRSELESAAVGIICLTKDNKSKPWILFEAGALSKSLNKGKVCPLLFNVDPTDLEGPLTIFQGTLVNKDEFYKLVCSINNEAEDRKLKTDILKNVFDKWWPDLEARFAEILNSDNNAPAEHSRSDRDILEEILSLTRLSGKDRSPRRSIDIETSEEVARLYHMLAQLIDFGEVGPAQEVLRKLRHPLERLMPRGTNLRPFGEPLIEEMRGRLIRRKKDFDQPKGD
ncbi:MAG: TIR domain-containing protein [Planctomycetota bacterium]